FLEVIIYVLDLHSYITGVVLKKKRIDYISSAYDICDIEHNYSKNIITKNLKRYWLKTDLQQQKHFFHFLLHIFVQCCSNGISTYILPLVSKSLVLPLIQAIEQKLIQFIFFYKKKIITCTCTKAYAF
ncbi:hypothetical protein ACJX0J_037567, partial [Zea mays]